MNERQSLHDSQYKGSLPELSRVVAAKKLKNPYRWQTVKFKLFYKGKNQYTKTKTESYVFNGFAVDIFRGWEWKSTTGRFATDRFGRLPERLLLSVRTKSINENYVNWKLRPLLFLQSWFNTFFHLKSQHQRTLVTWGLSTHLFSFTNEVNFSSQ